MYLTLNWEGVAGSAVAPEKWQMGVRITHLNPGTNTDAPRWTQKSLANITDASAVESTTDLDIDFGFDATTGPTNLAAAMYTQERQKDLLQDARLLAANLQTSISNQWRYVGSKLYAYNPAILTPTGAPKSLTSPTVSACKVPIVGTASGTPMPTQNALAVSLVSTGRGRGSKGRMYFGGFTTSALSATGVVAPAFVTSLNTSFRTFLNNINDAPSIDPLYGPAAVVWHRKDNSYSRIVAISTGNLVDTQRRRRRQLSEAYTEIAALDKAVQLPGVRPPLAYP
jgi:hypothetical protein